MANTPKTFCEDVMASEMVERVARAICNVSNPDCPPDCFEEQARAAIAAIREPTVEMLSAMGNAFRDAAVAYDPGDKPNTPFIRFKPNMPFIGFWRAGIDEALK